MKLSKLLQDIRVIEIYGSDVVEVKSLTDDSRKVKKDCVFVAIKGDTVDGHNFISNAIEKGAKVVFGEIEPDKSWLTKVTYLKIENSRITLSYLASNWFSNPEKKLRLIGVTGTDGKTTTANIIYTILKYSGKSVGLISTIGAKIGNEELDTGFHVTNPEPIQLFEFLRKIVDKGCEYCVLEVTSHGLDQHRVEPINFEVSVFTNITHEHLDYHKNWDNYFKSKMKLFEHSRKWIINKDDKSYAKILAIYPNKCIVTYSLKDKKSELYASNIQGDSVSQSFTITFKGQTLQGVTNLQGRYNISNILAAIGASISVGVDIEVAVKAVKNIPQLTGRFEEIKNDKGIRIIVDFAHTPNSLENVLTELRKTTKGKLIAVFGCASERDIRKRSLMPRISTRIADVSIFTAEDPRKEDINEILKQMEESVSDIDRSNYTSIPERGEAINYAINNLAKRGDTVVILGKGHEKSMSYNGIEYPWSDQEAVRLSLEGKVFRIEK